MGFSVTEKGFGYSGEIVYPKSRGRIDSASAKNYFQQRRESSGVNDCSAGQASAAEIYERMRRFRMMAGTKVPEMDSSAEGIGQAAEKMAEKATAKDTEAESVSSEAQEEAGSETDTQIIVKPDGTRVLVVTMNVGGTETSMTLEISKPTAMPNGNRPMGEGQPELTENPQSPEAGNGMPA